MGRRALWRGVLTAVVVRWVLPAYDEAASIEDLIDRIAEVSAREAWDYDILVIDDGSADATGEIVGRIARQGIPVRVLRNEQNRGLGFSIRRGLREASAAADAGDVIITLDADLTQDPAFAPSMVRRIEDGYDVVIASRYRAGSSASGLRWVRRILSRLASGLVTLLRPVRGVRDYSCGYRAYRAEVIQAAFERFGDDFITQRGFACMLEIAERLRDMASFTEVPFVLHYDAKRKGSAIRILPTIAQYFDVMVRVTMSGRRAVPVPVLLLAFASIALGTLGQVLLRTGAQGLAGMRAVPLVVSALGLPAVQLGLAAYVVSSLLWLAVLSRLDLSVAYPLGATGYVLVVLAASATGEPVSPLRWSGVMLIVVGVLLIGWLGAAPVVKARPR